MEAPLAGLIEDKRPENKIYISVSRISQQKNFSTFAHEIKRLDSSIAFTQTMKNLWNNTAAEKLKGDLLKLRVYTSQLLGAEPDLVLHGGGNTSVKISE